jgi:hypothetical protein
MTLKKVGKGKSSLGIAPWGECGGWTSTVMPESSGVVFGLQYDKPISSSRLIASVLCVNVVVVLFLTT